MEVADHLNGSASDLANRVLGALPAEIAVLDGGGVVVATNDAWRRTGGAEVGSHFIPQRCWPEEEDPEDLLATGVERILSGRGEIIELELPVDTDTGRRWKLILVNALPGTGAVITRVDVTRSHEVLDIVSDTALHDGLTRLPNRSLLEDRIATAVARTARGQSAPAVLFMDLDRFKAINDELGHETGDRVLAMVGQRLSSALRASDSCGRWGGDEFVAIVEVIPEENGDALAGVIDRICQTLNAPIELDGTLLDVGVSVGAVLVRPGDRPTELVAMADSAMYEAKRTGRHAAIAERDVIDVRYDLRVE